MIRLQQVNQFLTEFQTMSPKTTQVTMDSALLVRPKHFGFAEESATDNTYMDSSVRIDRAKASEQHQQLVGQLQDLGLRCHVFDGQPHTPDAVYPNNVFGFKPGHLIVGHMFHPVRQAEASNAELQRFFKVEQKRSVIDLSVQKGIAELTGSLIIDHARNFGFVGLSQRCDQDGAELMREAFGLAGVFSFALHPREYHTNIALAILAGRAAVIAPSGFGNAVDAEAIIKAYGKSALVIDEAQKNAFIGNCLAVRSDTVMMSQHAFGHLRSEQMTFFKEHGFNVIPVDVSELEKGGGSLRCLIAEVF
jgi:hypothetical protein